MTSPAVEGHGGGMAELAALVTRLTGLQTLDEPTGRALGAIDDAVRATGGSPAAVRRLLEHDADQFQDMVQRVTIGETHFLREPAHLELLRARILPELLRDRAATEDLHLWSAGCATGEEAYTLAIVLSELGLLDRARVVGTDISAAAIERARRATYRSWSLRGVDEDRRDAYFQQDGDRFVLDRRFVDRVDLHVLNLVSDAYPVPVGGFDVIFCRNVLLYLTPDAVEAVVRRMTAALAPGGWLVTASSDPHLPLVDGLERVATGRVVAHRRAGTHDDTGAPPAAARRPGRRPPRTRRRPLRDEADGRAASARPSEPAPVTPEGAHTEAYGRAVSSLEGGRWEEAARCAREALYLRDDLAVAEIAAGRAALGMGDARGAARAWRNARVLLEAMDPDVEVPLAGGTSAGRLLAELSALVARPRGGDT